MKIHFSSCSGALASVVGYWSFSAASAHLTIPIRWRSGRMTLIEAKAEMIKYCERILNPSLTGDLLINLEHYEAGQK